MNFFQGFFSFCMLGVNTYLHDWCWCVDVWKLCRMIHEMFLCHGSLYWTCFIKLLGNTLLFTTTTMIEMYLLRSLLHFAVLSPLPFLFADLYVFTILLVNFLYTKLPAFLLLAASTTPCPCLFLVFRPVYGFLGQVNEEIARMSARLYSV